MTLKEVVNKANNENEKNHLLLFKHSTMQDQSKSHEEDRIESSSI